MSAFYSGTDNNSDRQSINYSMVVGNIKPESYSYVIRFNLYEHKISAGIEDVFETMQDPGFTVPAEWLAKIQTPPPTHLPTSSSLINAYRTKSQVHSFGSATDQVRSRQSRRDTSSYGNYGSKSEYDFWNDLYSYTPDHIDWETGEILNYERKLKSQDNLFPEVEPSETPIDYTDENGFYKALYGEEMGEAMQQISTYLEDLTEEDEALVDIIRQAYAMLQDKGRSDLANNGF